MAAILTSDVLIFSIRCSGGSLAPPGFVDDPGNVIERFERLQAGLYQVDLSTEIPVTEIDINMNPCGFDASPPNFNNPPLMWPLLIGTEETHMTGLIIAIGTVGVGLVDHDFEVTVKRIRIQD